MWLYVLCVSFFRHACARLFVCVRVCVRVSTWAAAARVCYRVRRSMYVFLCVCTYLRGFSCVNVSEMCVGVGVYVCMCV